MHELCAKTGSRHCCVVIPRISDNPISGTQSASRVPQMTTQTVSSTTSVLGSIIDHSVIPTKENV